MRERRRDMLAWTNEAIRKPLSSLEDAAPQPAAADASWPASDAERRALWRRRTADEVRSLRASGRTDKDIVAILARRCDNQLARLDALGARDAFDVFMNAYVSAFDPHGGYLSQEEQRPARAGVPGHVGIGLVVQKKGDATLVREMTRNGSAARSGRLHAGDRIVGVAQGAGQPATDVVGWNVDEVVALLRGVPGSTVVLDVVPARAPAGTAPRSVPLVRNTPENADRAASRVEVLNRGGASYRIGIVTVPTFYLDFEAKRAGNADYISMTRDVAKLLATFKEQRVDAVLLDMRGNGGGSLTETTDLSDLFLPHAPVFQQRTYDGKLTLESAHDRAAAWEGPLAVLIDEGSAAATEIFAAAMQDHGRGVVLGDRSVGRSSMQTLLSLDRFAPKTGVRYGELKMTVAQLYRVNGETFEQEGVKPDVEIPGLMDPGGQAHRPGFGTGSIEPVAFDPRGEAKALLPALTQRHAKRTAADAAYQAMLRARAQTPGGAAPDTVDIGQVQLREALQVVGDQVELLRKRAVAGR